MPPMARSPIGQEAIVQMARFRGRFQGHYSSIARALQSLGNTVRGVPPQLLQQVVTACVLRRAYYASETWAGTALEASWC
jgi:hypothetical protein